MVQQPIYLQCSPISKWDSRTNTSSSLAALIASSEGNDNITSAEARKLASQRVYFPKTMDEVEKHFVAFSFLLKTLFGESSLISESFSSLTDLVTRRKRRLIDINVLAFSQRRTLLLPSLRLAIQDNPPERAHALPLLVPYKS